MANGISAHLICMRHAALDSHSAIHWVFLTLALLSIFSCATHLLLYFRHRHYLGNGLNHVLAMVVGADLCLAIVPLAIALERIFSDSERPWQCRTLMAWLVGFTVLNACMLCGYYIHTSLVLHFGEPASRRWWKWLVFAGVLVAGAGAVLEGTDTELFTFSERPPSPTRPPEPNATVSNFTVCSCSDMLENSVSVKSLFVLVVQGLTVLTMVAVVAHVTCRIRPLGHVPVLKIGWLALRCSLVAFPIASALRSLVLEFLSSSAGVDHAGFAIWHLVAWGLRGPTFLFVFVWTEVNSRGGWGAAQTVEAAPLAGVEETAPHSRADSLDGSQAPRVASYHSLDNARTASDLGPVGAEGGGCGHRKPHALSRQLALLAFTVDPSSTPVRPALDDSDAGNSGRASRFLADTPGDRHRKNSALMS